MTHDLDPFIRDRHRTGSNQRARPRTCPIKKILIVNCYFPETRQPVRLVNEVPNCLAPVFLAGAFHPELCEIRLHNEVSAGFVELFAAELLAWPDVLVLSGLTATFDRMLHLTAYTRTFNPRVIVIAGGLAVRALPRYARRFFDYACTGDAEEIREVIVDALGKEYLTSQMKPRYDLADWIGRRIAYVESSRNCNFRCSFCALTADGHPYRKQSLDSLHSQIAALGKRQILFFQDNQFHASDEQFLDQRMQLLRERREAGQIRYWSAFVTDSFFWEERNLRMAAEAGCFSLFVGVESFDELWLRRVNKAQNVRLSQIDVIRRCLEAGILFQYGLVFDPTERRIADMYREIETICRNPGIPLPNFIFMAIPLPGTPFFHDRYARGLILPATRLRDLEGSTLSLRSLDGVEEVGAFLGTTKNLRGYVRASLAHQREFLMRHGRSLGFERALASSITALSILAPNLVSNPRNVWRAGAGRSHVSTTDRLDCVYQPVRHLDSRYQAYFEPTYITDQAGNLNEALADDLLDTRWERRTPLLERRT